MNKLFLSAIACIICINVWAQDSTYRIDQHNNSRSDKRRRKNNILKMEEEGDLIFNKQNIFGIKIATDGYGIFFEKGKFISPKKTRILQFELNEKKSPKEKRISTGDLLGPSLVDYKLNNFYQFKVSMGEQRIIGGKGNKNGVIVSAIYTGGISLGIIKPYYLNLVDSADVTHHLTVDQLIADTVDNFSGISGASGFTVGWGHLSVKPGLNAKAALRFDYARFNTSVTAIEAGVNAEFYFGKVPLVYNVPQKQFFFNGYVTIMFGGRK